MNPLTHPPKTSASSKTTKLPLDQRQRSLQARKRLGVKKEDVDGCLKITSRLREVGLTFERVVDILDGDDSSDGRTFLDKVRTISKSDCRYLTIEEICLSSGLTTRRLWEVISGARLEQSQDAVKLMVADAQPRVMSQAIKAATESVPIMDGEGNVSGWTHGDMKATELIWKATGILPTPKGTTINLQQNNATGPLPIDDDGDDDGILLPDMDDVVKDLQITVKVKQLEAPRVEIPIQTAEYLDVPLSSPRA